MRVLIALVIALLALADADAQEQGAFDLLHREDLRVAAIAEVMLTANRGLCRTHMPVTGMILHSQDQYGEAGRGRFADGSLALAGVLAGSPAEHAGLGSGDTIVAIGGQAVTGLASEGALLRDRAFEHVAGLPASQAIDLVIVRGGRTSSVTVRPEPGCRALVEVLAEEGRIARSDGRVIQLSFELTTGLSDDGLAATIAHELAHLVLEHRRRLSEAGVKKGLLAEFGSNRRRNRQAEVEADRLSVHLLYNAGFDPLVAPRFWLSEEGRRVDAGIFRSTIYPSPSKRAELMQREMAGHLVLGGGPSGADHLIAMRDEPF